MSEFIYILENYSMPGLVKIGRTERSVSERVNELSAHTGVPTGFTVVKEYAVANSVEAERIIHERLSDYRVADNREFFKIEAEDATDIIESMLKTVKPETRRDFEREDELVAKAIPIVAEEGMARPRMLEERLGISYQEALIVIHTLRGRGVIGQHNESKYTSRPKPPTIMQKPDPVTVAATPLIGNYWLPPMDFLQHSDMTAKPTELKEELMANARLLQQTLVQFEIEVALGDITKGPTITRYELHPAPGVKLEEISALSNNLAAALKAEKHQHPYTRAARMLDELEARGIVGPSKGGEPRDILIDLDASDYTPPIKQPPIIQPHLVVCACEHCSENIEFDADELGDRESVSVSCPYCGAETEISNPC